MDKSKLDSILSEASKLVFQNPDNVRKAKILGYASDSLVYDNTVSQRVPICDVFDAYTRGGIPIGRVTEIFGDPSKGKSTILGHAYAGVQKMGGVAVHLLSEEEIDSSRWARIGVDINKLIVIPIEVLEQGFDVISNVAVNAAKLDVPSLIGWDTMTAAKPNNEKLARDSGDPKLRYKDGMMSKFKVIRDELADIQHKLARNKCGLILVQQSIASTAPYSQTESGGGGGPKFYASLRLYVHRGKRVNIEESNTGIITTIEIRKSKVCPPWRSFSVGISDEHGVDNDYSTYLNLYEDRQTEPVGYSYHQAWYTVSVGDKKFKFRWSDWKSILDKNPEIREYLKSKLVEVVK